MGSFTGSTAVITGASSGVGKAIACGLAAEGASLCLVGRALDRLEAAAAQAGGGAGRVRCYAADLSRSEDIRTLCERVGKDCESVDILVHSAGVIVLGPIERASGEEFDAQYQVNVRAPYLLTQGLLSRLTARRGQIVFINSTSGLIARAGVGQYAATKYALRAVADSIREEVNGDGVRVLSLFLGRTATPMQAAVHRMEGRVYQPDYLVQPQDVASVVLNALRLPRTAEVTEISMRPFRKPAEAGS